jgi:hypothetical protein
VLIKEGSFKPEMLRYIAKIQQSVEQPGVFLKSKKAFKSEFIVTCRYLLLRIFLRNDIDMKRYQNIFVMQPPSTQHLQNDNSMNTITLIL